MRYGAIDIGTNSCRLLIAEVNAENEFNLLYKELETTRMGEGISQSNLLKEEAIERTLLCLNRFREKMQHYNVDKYRAIATSAVREAGNGAQFVGQARYLSQVEVNIVGGEEEARLSYLGVKRGLKLTMSPLVVDLGGGSTEFICPDEDMLISVPLGAVRATEADMYAVQISQVLTPIARVKERFKNRPLVMVGGTATTLVAVKKGLDEYNADLVHGEILSRTEIGDLYNLMERMPLSLRRRMPGLQPERADIINKGALIMLMIVDALGKSEVVVSESELLQGVVWSLAGEN